MVWAGGAAAAEVAKLTDGMTREQPDCGPYWTPMVSPDGVAERTRRVRSE